MTLASCKKINGQFVEIALEYNPAEREITEVYEIRIENTNVYDTLLSMGLENNFINLFDWEEIYLDRIAMTTISF